MSTRPVFSMLLAAFLAAPSFARAADYTIDPSHTTVSFRVRHMMVTWVRGEFGKVSGTITYDPKAPEKTVANITIDVVGLDTRDEKRNEHLRSPDFFDTANFPTATFVSTSAARTGDTLALTGNLTIRGKSKPVVLAVTGITSEMKDPWGNLKIGAAATSTINRHDWGVSWNKTLDAGGVLVGDDVELLIEVEGGRK
jgi:polyisoprenoid-binding protein YceI